MEEPSLELKNLIEENARFEIILKEHEENLLNYYKYKFLLKTKEFQKIQDVLTVCTIAGWNLKLSIDNINDYTLIDKEHSVQDMELTIYENVDYYNHNILPINKFQLKYLSKNQQLNMKKWKISEKKLLDFISKKLFKQNNEALAGFLTEHSNTLDILRRAFFELRESNYDYYRVAHVTLISKIFIQEILSPFSSDVLINPKPMTVEFEQDDKKTLKVREKIFLIAGNGHIVVKRPYDELYKSDAIHSKNQLMVVNEGFWGIDRINDTWDMEIVSLDDHTPFGTGLLFDLFALWVSYRSENGIHYISNRVIDTKAVLLRILLLAVKDLTEKDLNDLSVDDDDDDDDSIIYGTNKTKKTASNDKEIVGNQENNDFYIGTELRSGCDNTDNLNLTLKSAFVSTKKCGPEELNEEEVEEMERGLLIWDSHSRGKIYLSFENLRKNS